MKTLIFALLVSSPVFACVTTSPELSVTSAIVVTLPGQRPPMEDGTSRYPFRSIKKAILHGHAQDYCSTKIKLTVGNHFYDGSPINSDLSIVGTDRATSVIKGGLYVRGPFKLYLEKVTLQVSGQRAIYMNGGELKTKEISIKDYHFSPLRPFARPSAIQLVNTEARLLGLEAYNSDQPILRIEGEKSRVKASFFTIRNTKMTSFADTNSVPARFGAAVEVTDGALANFMLTDFKNIEYSGILIENNASVYGASVGINTVTMPDPSITTVINGVLASNARAVQLNGFLIQGSVAAGIIFVNSFITLQNGATSWNHYGIVSQNSPNMNQNGYNTFLCTTSMNVDLSNNTTQGYVTTGSLPVPSDPLPIPCSGECPQTPPNPTPEKPPVICPTVEMIF